MTKKKIKPIIEDALPAVPVVLTPARTFNHVKDGMDYVPVVHTPSRPGAEDALKIKSKGYPT